MPEMHLKEQEITYSACGLNTKNRKRIQKFYETGDSRYISQNELDKECFQNDIAYEHFKDLTRRTASDKMLRDKAFNIAKNSKYDGYQRGLLQWFRTFFEKKTSGSGIKNDNMSDQQLAEDLHKPIIRNFHKKNYTHLF